MKEAHKEDLSDMVYENEDAELLSDKPNKINHMNKPRTLYEEGQIKLDFEHRFSSGEILKMREDENGIASVILERNGKIVIDFADFLGPLYKFVTPTYFKKHVLELALATGGMIGKWATSPGSKKVLIGDVRYPTEIFALLHEIGHSNQVSGKEFLKEVLKTVFLESTESSVANISRRERNAWAQALHIAREIKTQHGVNLFEVFENFDEFQKFIYDCLLGHRLAIEGKHNKFQSSDLSRAWRFIQRYLFSNKEEKDIFIKLFDKRKHSSRTVSSMKNDWEKQGQ